MIEILQGKKIILLENILEIIKKKKNTLIDIGTGDGKYPYYFALKNQDYFVIGIDPVKKLMKKYSLKTTFKTNKGGVNNLFYVIASLENLPEILNELATTITINLPWGSLLETIVKANIIKLKYIVNLAKNNCIFRTIFTYDEIYESNEIKKRFLPELSILYLKSITHIYEKIGINITYINKFDFESLKNLKTLWAKKLFISKKREVYILSGFIKK